MKRIDMDDGSQINLMTAGDLIKQLKRLPKDLVCVTRGFDEGGISPISDVRRIRAAFPTDGGEWGGHAAPGYELEEPTPPVRFVVFEAVFIDW